MTFKPIDYSKLEESVVSKFAGFHTYPVHYAAAGEWIKNNSKSFRDLCWVSRDMKFHPLNQMKTQHIKNCIDMCKRQKWRMKAIPYLEKELLCRTEMGKIIYE